MQLASIHPIDPVVAQRFGEVLAIPGGSIGLPGLDGTLWLREQLDAAERSLAVAVEGREQGANAISLAFARILAAAQPSFVHEGVSLSALEASIDRGVGMLLRPPSRLFAELGIPIAAARAMPIRLDNSSSMMGGAYMPPGLVPRFRDLLVERDVRFVLRLHESGFEAVAVYGLLLEIATYATDRGMGLIEAVDAVTPDMPRYNPPGARIVLADARRMEPETVRRLTDALKPPKRTLMDRLSGRRAPSLN